MKMKQGFHTCFFELPFACRVRSSCNRSQAVARQLKESSLQVAFVQGGQLRCPRELLALLAARDGRASNFLKAIEQSSIMDEPHYHIRIIRLLMAFKFTFPERVSISSNESRTRGSKAPKLC